MIAGHTFDMNGWCSCGKRFSDISFAAYGEEWIEKLDIAHSRGLTETEQKQIAAEVERIHAAAMEGARF